MTVLREAGAQVEALRPPPVEELTVGERGRLRAALGGAVESWPRADAIGLRVAQLRRAAAPEVGDGGAWFRAAGAPVALGLTPRAAVSLVCVSLGAAMPAEPKDRLSGMDVAVLEAWAGRALPALAEALGVGPAEELERVRGCPRGLAGVEGEVVVGELAFAGEVPAGTILVAAEHARGGEAGGRATLGDHPGALLRARVMAEAVIRTGGVALAELLALEVGDVLVLGPKGEVEAQLVAGGAVVGAGRPGARGGARAVRIGGCAPGEDASRPGGTADGF